MTSPKGINLVERKDQSATSTQTAVPWRELRPRVDIYENPDELLMLADMPGADAESVNVRLEAAQLTLQALRASEGQGVRYHRAFQVPDLIDPEQVSAELKNGVLHVHLRKSEAAKPRTIPIRTS